MVAYTINFYINTYNFTAQNHAFTNPRDVPVDVVGFQVKIELYSNFFV